MPRHSQQYLPPRGEGHAGSHFNHPDLWSAAFPHKGEDAHKYSFGHVAIVAGDLPGATQLAARAAQRAGAGLVTIACDDSSRLVFQPFAGSLLVRCLSTPAALPILLADERINAILLGSGWDKAAISNTVLDCLKQASTSRAIVLDAGALNAFATEPERLFTAIKDGAAKVVLTPHSAEFGRLFGRVLPAANSLNQLTDKVQAARQAAHISGAVIVLKGAYTVIAGDHGCWINDARACPWLATAGSGDVLAGMIVGLLAQGLPPLAAAGAACWGHTRAAGRYEGRGMVAEDLVSRPFSFLDGEI